MIRPYFDKSSARQVRSRNRKRSVSKLVIGTVLLAISVALVRSAAGWTARQGWFNIAAVTVSGNRLVPAAEVSAIARFWLRKPFWSVDRDRMASALRRRFPAVKNAECAVRPWWTLSVTVREREAVARVESDSATVISPEGVFFRDSTRSNLPCLRIAGSSEAGRMRAINALMANPAAKPDWLFDPSDERDIKLLAGGTVVHLGDGDFAEVWRKYGEIRRDLEQGGTAAATIDLRFRDQGIVVMKEQTAAGRAGTAAVKN